MPENKEQIKLTRAELQARFEAEMFLKTIGASVLASSEIEERGFIDLEPPEATPEQKAAMVKAMMEDPF